MARNQGRTRAKPREIPTETIRTVVNGRPAAVIVPVIPDDAGPVLREGLRRRRIGGQAGWCPCGARRLPSRDEGGGVTWTPIPHKPNCVRMAARVGATYARSNRRRRSRRRPCHAAPRAPPPRITADSRGLRPATAAAVAGAGRALSPPGCLARRMDRSMGRPGRLPSRPGQRLQPAPRAARRPAGGAARVLRPRRRDHAPTAGVERSGPTAACAPRGPADTATSG